MRMNKREIKKRWRTFAIAARNSSRNWMLGASAWRQKSCKMYFGRITSLPSPLPPSDACFHFETHKICIILKLVFVAPPPVRPGLEAARTFLTHRLWPTTFPAYAERNVHRNRFTMRCLLQRMKWNFRKQISLGGHTTDRSGGYETQAVELGGWEGKLLDGWKRMRKNGLTTRKNTLSEY